MKDTINWENQKFSATIDINPECLEHYQTEVLETLIKTMTTIVENRNKTEND